MVIRCHVVLMGTVLLLSDNTQAIEIQLEFPVVCQCVIVIGLRIFPLLGTVFLVRSLDRFLSFFPSWHKNQVIS